MLHRFFHAFTAHRWLLGLICALVLLTANAEERPQVLFQTNHGAFTVELYPNAAPLTVENILQLVEDKFYTDLLFHRVIANFMVQTGGFDLDLVYKEPPRTVVNESFNGLSNRKGFVAMARTDEPDSADTQFFINVRDNERLDAKVGVPGYTVFGRVISGWRVVESIELVNTGISQGMAAVPLEPVILESANRVR